MFRIVFVICLTFVVIQGHLINRGKIKKLRKLVEEYKEQQDKIYNKLSLMETSMTERIDKLASGGAIVPAQACPAGTVSKCIGDQTSTGQANLDLVEDRLKTLENEMDEIIKYLTAEKETDKVLKTKSSEVIKEMEDKVQETENVIVGLQETVGHSLDKFENMIHEVNKSAQVTINSKGVIFYGGVGSSCTYDDDCLTNYTECRSRKCQCDPGLSYNLDKRICEETCDTYGQTYQSVYKYIIRGYNNLTLEDVESVDECKQRCNEETQFPCITIDYFPRWSECYLSEFTKLDVPDEAFEYNSAGIHFQRDCA